MKHIHTPSHTFMAVRFDTTGSVERKPFDVVKKLSIVVTPANTILFIPSPFLFLHPFKINNIYIYKIIDFQRRLLSFWKIVAAFAVA